MTITGSRAIDPNTKAAAAAPLIHPVLFVKLEFDGGDVNMHTELGDIIFGGDTYTGIGKLGGISGMEENSDLSRTPISLSLSGIPNDLVSILLGEQYQGRTATIFLGYLDLTGAFNISTITTEDGATSYTAEDGSTLYTIESGAANVMVADPVIIYKGNIDTADFAIDKSFAVTISVESRFAAWDKPLTRRYNNSDQQSRHPGDKGLQFVEQAASKTLWWGQATPV